MAMPMPAEWSFGATIPAKDLDGTRRFYGDVLGAPGDDGGVIRCGWRSEGHLAAASAVAGTLALLTSGPSVGRWQLLGVVADL